MTITLSGSATSATTAALNAANYGANGSIDLQISPRRDFQFCVCPTYSMPLQAALNVVGLNQVATYYARARTRLASGAVEDWSNVIGFRTPAAAARVTTPAQVMIEPTIMVVPTPIIGTLPSFTVAGYPIDNLFRDSPVAYRTNKVAADTYYFSVQTSGEPIDTIALLNTNVPESARWIVQCGNVYAQQQSDILYTSPDVTFRASPNLPGRPGYHGLMQLPGPQTYPIWRVTLYNCPLTADMLHAEHLVLGLNRATKNFSLDMTETPTTQTTVERKRSGIPDRVRGLPMRKVDMDLSLLTEAQYETVYRDLIALENEAMLCVPNSRRGAFFHDRILLGDLTSGRIVNPSSPRFTRTFGFNSIIA